ncbi:uncharacterized protein PG998_000016 [Apiospora kogelbergensis]|uniref:uncharacterized protein n=1 Tax=Apiospora kogelbergensis TaxID=1337665 RepID=UPI00312D5613
MDRLKPCFIAEKALELEVQQTGQRCEDLLEAMAKLQDRLQRADARVEEVLRAKEQFEEHAQKEFLEQAEECLQDQAREWAEHAETQKNEIRSLELEVGHKDWRIEVLREELMIQLGRVNGQRRATEQRDETIEELSSTIAELSKPALARRSWDDLPSLKKEETEEEQEWRLQVESAFMFLSERKPVVTDGSIQPMQAALEMRAHGSNSTTARSHLEWFQEVAPAAQWCCMESVAVLGGDDPFCAIPDEGSGECQHHGGRRCHQIMWDTSSAPSVYSRVRGEKTVQSSLAAVLYP